MLISRRNMLLGTGAISLACERAEVGLAQNGTPAATPEDSGLLLLYQTFAPGTTYFALATAHPDGSDARIIASEGDLGAKHPQWSPDGRAIAFINHFDGSIWTMDADGANQTRLLSCGDICSFADYPTWSPDGSHLAFVAFTGNLNEPPAHSAIVTLDLATLQTSILIEENLPHILDTPRWSPDGSRIAVSVVELDGDLNVTGSAIGLVSSDGGEITYLTGFDQFGYQPDWNTVSGQVVFGLETQTWTDEPVDTDLALNLFQVAADGTGLAALTDVPKGVQLIQPVWTPDGLNIIATRITSGGEDVVIIDSATGEMTPIPLAQPAQFVQLQPSA